MLWIQTLRQRPRVLAFALAFIAAGAAVLLAHDWTEQQQAHFKALSKPKGGAIDVLVFSKSLEAGDVLTDKTLAVRSVQKSLVPEGVFSPDQFSQVSGRKLGTPAKKGELLLPQNLAAIQHQDALSLARPGFRLIPVDRSSGQMAWSAMTPRDRIDVWAIGVSPDDLSSLRSDQGGFLKEMSPPAPSVARSIATGVRVLSSGEPSTDGALATKHPATASVTYFLELPEASVSAYLGAASTSQVRYVLNVNGRDDRRGSPAKPKPVEILIHDEGVNG